MQCDRDDCDEGEACGYERQRLDAPETLGSPRGRLSAGDRAADASAPSSRMFGSAQRSAPPVRSHMLYAHPRRRSTRLNRGTRTTPSLRSAETDWAVAGGGLEGEVLIAASGDATERWSGRGIAAVGYAVIN